MNIVIYDIEILRAIRRPNEEVIPGVEYCGGFDDHENCGISTLCAYEEAPDGSIMAQVFCADNLKEFQTVVDQARWVIGFNNSKFDDKVCLANGIVIPFSKSIDLLRQMWIAAGLDPDNYQKETHAGFGLDAVCKLAFGVGKSLDGYRAPIEWQRGNYGKVISYCLRDVALTYRLFERIQRVRVIPHPLRPSEQLRVDLFGRA